MRYLIVCLVCWFAVACSSPEPTAPIRPFACGGTCSSSVECRSAFDDCRSCFNGHCSGTLPAEPLPVDAGVPNTGK